MLTRKQPLLAIIIPCLNEEGVIEQTSNRLLEVMDELASKGKIDKNSFIYIVDDGSTDNTWTIAENMHKKSRRLKGIKLSKNFGNQNALSAGFTNVRKHNPDCVLTIDADLQQDENTIEKFIDSFSSGCDIVCGIRNDRKTDTLIKKICTYLFYKFMSLMDIKHTENHSDYRLISKKALDAICEYREVNLYFRGIINELGFKTDYVNFDTKQRSNGKSRFTYKKLIALALDGITSFSIIPLRMVAIIGILMALFSFGLGLEVMYEKYVLHTTIPGWTTIIVAISFIGGIQIFCTGIIGEYLGQVYKEVKARPRYIKDKELI